MQYLSKYENSVEEEVRIRNATGGVWYNKTYLAYEMDDTDFNTFVYLA